MSRSRTAARIAELLEEHPNQIPYVIGFLSDGVTAQELRDLEKEVRAKVGLDVD